MRPRHPSDSIKTCVPPIGLIVCDEGHRLKSKDNKTTKMFDSLSTKRRIS
jgi:DNA repair and recombination protein RAD54B